MTLSLYAVTVPVYVRLLTALRDNLDKAQAYADEKKFNSDVLVGSRLAPDMHPLSFQVQSATDHVKGSLARLAGRDIPAWPDDEKTLADLKARIGKAVDFANSFSAGDIDGSETRSITLKMRSGEVVVDGQSYVLTRALPNFYFHVTTAYAILRHNGVPIGKRDFLG
ncbi:hypothetical protein SAMN02983003_0927 [Devosia enhydra]|uniref:DUF1993 domain-containing protein n=1 Tax=Devosia enhydra TaxID=665118 RepID=A0A1K2HUK0_9HYPH|nr:DUF1993 domain-containing protein [Devosia enhydra]SFZ82186.1 hypothetical protein SAMN02983003_0927 [Devosia enhydra]